MKAGYKGSIDFYISSPIRAVVPPFVSSLVHFLCSEFNFNLSLLSSTLGHSLPIDICAVSFMSNMCVRPYGPMFKSRVDASEI